MNSMKVGFSFCIIVELFQIFIFHRFWVFFECYRFWRDIVKSAWIHCYNWRLLFSNLQHWIFNFSDHFIQFITSFYSRICLLEWSDFNHIRSVFGFAWYSIFNFENFVEMSLYLSDFSWNLIDQILRADWSYMMRLLVFWWDYIFNLQGLDFRIHSYHALSRCLLKWRSLALNRLLKSFPNEFLLFVFRNLVKYKYLWRCELTNSLWRVSDMKRSC